MATTRRFGVGNSLKRVGNVSGCRDMSDFVSGKKVGNWLTSGKFGCYGNTRLSSLSHTTVRSKSALSNTGEREPVASRALTLPERSERQS